MRGATKKELSAVPYQEGPNAYGIIVVERDSGAFYHRVRTYQGPAHYGFLSDANRAALVYLGVYNATGRMSDLERKWWTWGVAATRDAA